ncbi:AraC family transcriptional regulator [Anaerocolumna sedimenticola]|uniref:AraC family transcriptional regulator n=1 Tax=Anaerocolumna sedimenticola TaxID=2696063 RepID=A0A6P1TP50_9FIRM|nr:AraC family transcriptional regulator [Anaerocolumna sedimenticola]QHQ61586.1 AraC family transcriptional regulator [Anaerocolumna sedimenticola]
MSGLNEVKSINKNIFDTIMMKCLLRGFNVCAPDWGETDCIYGYYKFYYFKEGEATIIINGDTYYPEPGELYLIPANTKHTYMHNPLNPVLKYWCHFDLTFNGEQKVVYSKETLHCLPPQEVVTPLFERLISLDSSSNLLDILSEKAILIELFKIFLEHINPHKLIPQSSDNFVTKINDYIIQNLQSVITLKNIAEIVHLHPNYFIQFFEKYFSVSPMEYVNIVRLEKATQLFITKPDLSIEQVAYSVGYKDYRYFGRVFKKRYGMTPSAYKGLQKFV